MPDPTAYPTTYFIQSRPAPGQPWQTPSPRWTTEDRARALHLLRRRREQQPGWEYRLMERVTTVVVRPAAEDA